MIRSFLFLQGVSSPFFAELARRLRSEGHNVAKVNFTGGDAFYWKMRGGTSFRKDVLRLPEFYEALFDKSDHFTDIVMFGDCRPVNATVTTEARRRGIRIHVYEEGYFRPYWVTLERDGVNNSSKLPRDPDWYREVGRVVPHYENGQAFDSSFFIRAWHDIQYHAWGTWNPVFYPGYRTHAPYTAPLEYMGFINRYVGRLISARQDRINFDEIISTGVPFYFLPLQLDSDAQIREHSSYDGMADVLTDVMRSFALNAPADTKLVVKNHPLDPGMTSYRKLIKNLERTFDIEGRTVFLEMGHLPTLLDHALGVVTVNSTVGASALLHRRPTVTLGDPIYNISGLTFRGSLGEFWRNAAPPDMTLFRRFRDIVIHTTQVNGGFYSSAGVKLAVNNSINSLVAEKSPLEMLL